MRAIIAISIFLFLISAPAGAEIYKCIDANGAVTFNTKPGPGCTLLPESVPKKETSHDIKKGYEGGNLHRATVKIWNQAPYRNRLATSGDWFVVITKGHNPTLQKTLQLMPPDQFLAASKTAAAQLEQCVSDRVRGQKQLLGVKVATIAASCYTSLYEAGDSLKIDWETATEMVKQLPCKKGGTIDEYLTKKAGVPAVEDLDWHTYPRDDGFEVERFLLLNNRTQLLYKWHVSFDGNVRAINGKAMGITAGGTN